MTATPGKHLCRRCPEDATYYSVRLGSDNKTTFYFYCRKHKTPAAKPLTERKP
jgi:hypothetical protein